MIDNNLDRFEYNSITASLFFDKFETKFNFVEENGNIGNEKFLETQQVIILMIKLFSKPEE